MKNYKTFMSEMARNIGKPFSRFENVKGFKNQHFLETKDQPSIDIDLKLHKSIKDNVV